MKRVDEASHAFLGEEFLTWLWYQLETEGGDFELTRERQVAVMIDDFLAFAPAENDETEQTLRHGAPTRSAEARAALRSGRRLRKAKLLVAQGERQWSVTVDGPTLNLLSVKLPEDPEDSDGPEEIDAERIAGFLELFEIVQEVYGKFLEQRLRPDYLKSRGEAQARWMAGGA